MRAALDTSVLVAGVVASHPHHPRAAAWLDAIARGDVEGVASVHAFAETFATLSRLPLSPPITPGEAAQLVARLRSVIAHVDEDDGIVAAAVERCARHGATSGAVFDAIHVVSAEAAKADIPLTFDARHFSRFAIATTPRVVVPPDPPSLDVDV